MVTATLPCEFGYVAHNWELPASLAKEGAADERVADLHAECCRLRIYHSAPSRRMMDRYMLSLPGLLCYRTWGVDEPSCGLWWRMRVVSMQSVVNGTNCALWVCVCTLPANSLRRRRRRPLAAISAPTFALFFDIHM